MTSFSDQETENYLSISSPRSRVTLYRLGFQQSVQSDYTKYIKEQNIYKALQIIDIIEQEFRCILCRYFFNQICSNGVSSDEYAFVNQPIELVELLNTQNISMSSYGEMKKINQQRCICINDLKKAFFDLYLRFKDLSIKSQLQDQITQLLRSTNLKITTAAKFLKYADQLYLLEAKKQNLARKLSFELDISSILQKRYQNIIQLQDFVQLQVEPLFELKSIQIKEFNENLAEQDKSELNRLTKMNRQAQKLTQSGIIQQPIKWQTSIRYQLKPCNQLFSDEEVRFKQVAQIKNLQKSLYKSSVKDLKLESLWPKSQLKSQIDLKQIQESIFLQSLIHKDLDCDQTLLSITQLYKSQLIEDPKITKTNYLINRKQKLLKKQAKSENERINALNGSQNSLKDVLRKQFVQERLVEKKQIQEIDLDILRIRIQGLDKSIM
ncbi:hypothetical protein SS50377_24364 [Spironucleus salmonicida]|uniref:Uncharacterized protein n=1 Tax=Spironucleus salmonicida TaxID=348837 RepID=V6LN75_9EUKA|nr:hypothetical protein SS50377_24364 [Spironucleus salmonicida]|eukprot:EST46085.1 Hypothetical protein SS50377_14075 [Spironucleus salmonicida]